MLIVKTNQITDWLKNRDNLKLVFFSWNYVVSSSFVAIPPTHSLFFKIKSSFVKRRRQIFQKNPSTSTYHDFVCGVLILGIRNYFILTFEWPDSGFSQMMYSWGIILTKGQLGHSYTFWFTVFPHIIAAATILFWIHLVRKLFKERKLINGGNYMRKYGMPIMISSLTSVPKKTIPSSVVIHYCTWYYFFRNGR